MKRALTAGMILFSALSAVQAQDGSIEWIRDPQAGLSQAASEGRSAMLYFTADW